MASEEARIFLQPDEQRNFALLIEGMKVYVSREFLACWSPVFVKIFYPEGAPFEQPEEGMQMKEKKLEDFLVFLQAICPTAKALRIDESNLAVLVAYADEYDVGVLRDRCVEFMQKQLRKGKVAGEGLIEYLRLATLYNLKGLQKELVPIVAQLSIDKIKSVHEMLPLSVLAAVYQAKALAQQADAERDRTPMLLEGAFHCTGCGSETCGISKGASSCCNKGVVILVTAAAQVEAQCSLTCAKCSKPCSLKEMHRNRFCYSSCCTDYLFVYAKWCVCKERSADPTAPIPKATNFSTDLLDRDK